jgi:hypothetical protein
MLKQIAALPCADPPPRWSCAFDRLWRVQVLGLPADPPTYITPGIPSDAAIWAQQKREWRVGAMIPGRKRLDGSVWGHANIGWGPSPSGKAIRRGFELNARDIHQETAQQPQMNLNTRRRQSERPTCSPETAASRLMAEAVARDFEGIVAPDSGLATYEAPSETYPRGRAFIMALALQYPERWKGIWRKLTRPQRAITLSYYGEIGGSMQDVADRHGIAKSSVCMMLARVNKLVAGAGLPELMQCRTVSVPTIGYSKYFLDDTDRHRAHRT